MTSEPVPTGPPSDLDYSALSAMFINCTLKRSPAPSHTDHLMRGLKKLFTTHGVSVDEIRAIDHRIATGMSPDMTEEGWSEDEWPAIFERVMAADILVLGTPLWLGEKTSVCTRMIERLYSSSGTFNAKGQFTFVDKVAGWIVTGNEDGVKHTSMNLSFSLSHLGYTIPPNGDAGWIGEIGPGPSFGDDGEVGLDNSFTHRNISLMAWNLMHMAAILKQRPGGIPAWGTAMDSWLNHGERFGTPPLRELVGE
ncbi:MAG: flavodoxin family protein [Thermoleophilia bacterium]|nr:flavodoxin family protein [Thermoleophilia bacterium]